MKLWNRLARTLARDWCNFLQRDQSEWTDPALQDKLDLPRIFFLTLLSIFFRLRVFLLQPFVQILLPLSLLSLPLPLFPWQGALPLLISFVLLQVCVQLLLPLALVSPPLPLFPWQGALPLLIFFVLLRRLFLPRRCVQLLLPLALVSPPLPLFPWQVALPILIVSRFRLFLPRRCVQLLLPLSGLSQPLPLFPWQVGLPPRLLSFALRESKIQLRRPIYLRYIVRIPSHLVWCSQFSLRRVGRRQVKSFLWAFFNKLRFNYYYAQLSKVKLITEKTGLMRATYLFNQNFYQY